EDLSLGLVQKKITEYLQVLLHHFDESVCCNNINQYLDAPLLKKLPANYFYCCNYPELLDYRETSRLPDLCNVVDNVMDSYEEKPNQETEANGKWILIDFEEAAKIGEERY
ncbi:5121_t:CDS:2, partial [Funneliformis geosporum]